MKILISNAKICDKQSSFNNKTCDIIINGDLIESIEISKKKTSNSNKNILFFDAKEAKISPAFMDMRAQISDPGFEFKEDLHSAANSAAAGGFSAIACLPNTLPTVSSKSEVKYIIGKAKKSPIYIYPYGTISQKMEGEELSEMFDMHKAGAIGFTDANKSIKNSNLLLRALLYNKIFDGLILIHAEDQELSVGKMHEGKVSTSLGLKGTPSIAEEIIIQRDIEIAKYAESKIHFSHLSSKGSVDLIRKAKKHNEQISCDVAVSNLCFTDQDLSTYDSNFKTSPPLRSMSDKKALWDGLFDGTIDCIVTDHCAQNPELKEVEFEYAEDGMIMLQTAFSLLVEYKPKNFDLELLIEKLSANPRKICKLPDNSIKKGNRAELLIFDEKKKWQYDEKNNLSKSKNSPILGKQLTGKTIALVNKGLLHTFSS